ncbi:tRNA (adenosine(37)-N6)-threonylcarbamoyltransferase complex ATPase subunit type 1 TsaE [bacterium]|nr:tRNA (adenosine(37)-N6)-threonylcarbamoyltransferase complex ATPase subunit type 1 TsaE [bacterium]
MTTSSAQETEILGENLAHDFEPGDVIALYGDLGAGKTCWVRGVAKALAAREAVTSPTFTLINEYHGKIPVYHFDLYRLQSTRELEDIGYEEYFYGEGISILEWAEKAECLLPKYHWKIYFDIRADEERQIIICPPGQKERV